MRSYKTKIKLVIWLEVALENIKFSFYTIEIYSCSYHFGYYDRISEHIGPIES